MVIHPLRRLILLLGSGVPAAALILSLVTMLNTVAAAFEFPSARDSATDTAELTSTTCARAASPIPDGDGTRLQSTLLLSDALRLSNLSVLLRVSHSWPGDLSFTLSHAESGRTITLVDRPGVPDRSPYGCGVDDIDAFLADGSTEAVENVCNPSPPGIGGELQPDQPLSTFQEVLLAGTWTLTAQDHATGEVGTLDEWCLVASGTVPPRAALAPDRIATLQGPEQRVTHTVEVSNTGGESLTWQLGASAPTSSVPAISSTFVVSEGFESAQFPPAGWTVTNMTVTPTWTLIDDDFHGGVAYGGEAATAWQLEGWLQTPPVDLSAATLTFWSWGNVSLCRDNDDLCDLNVWLVTEDDAALFVHHVDDDWRSGETGWVRSEIPLDPLLPVGPVRIAFHYRGQGVPVLLDDVRVTVPAPTQPSCHCGGELPWFTGSPLSGELAPGANTVVSLTLSAAGLNEGVYTGTLCLESNDPVAPGLPLPLTMTVDACTLQPAVVVSLTATSAGADLLLRWASDNANKSYEVHASPHPFFQPGEGSRIAILTETDTSYLDEQALVRSPAAFYRLRARNCSDTLWADSRTVGFFSFPLQ